MYIPKVTVHSNVGRIALEHKLFLVLNRTTITININSYSVSVQNFEHESSTLVRVYGLDTSRSTSTREIDVI